MGTSVTVAGQNYTVPAYNDTGWAQGSGNLSQLLIALAANIATSPTFMQFVSVTASPQAVLNGKTYLTTTSSVAITFNLPAPAANLWFIVKDISGDAGTNNMTLHRNGTEKIDGVAADATINIPDAFVLVVSDGTDWYILLEV